MAKRVRNAHAAPTFRRDALEGRGARYKLG